MGQDQCEPRELSHADRLSALESRIDQFDKEVSHRINELGDQHQRLFNFAAKLANVVGVVVPDGVF